MKKISIGNKQIFVRHFGRILAFQSLYWWDVAHPSLGYLLRYDWLIEHEEFVPLRRPEAIEFGRLLTRGTLQHIETVDGAIHTQLEHWDMDRLARVDLAILRISIYALLYLNRTIPPLVTIDEAVELAKEYGSGDSYRFINGVLDGVCRSHELGLP